MPLYEFECTKCNHRFDRRLPMSRRDEVTHCPECQGDVRRLITGGSGFIIKGGTRVGINPCGPVGGRCCKEEGKKGTCCGDDPKGCSDKKETGCGGGSCGGH
mgnify:CR=1 FL=1